MRSLILVAVLIALPAGAATIDVAVTSSAGSPIPNAVVYAVPPQTMPLARNRAVMDQINRTFVPHVLPVQTGTWVDFPNSDNVRHQVFSVSPARKFSTPLYAGKLARPIQFSKSGIVAIGCTIHEQMSAYIIVVDTPYFATTTEAGRAAMRDVVGGEYTVRVWYPGMRDEPKPQKVTVGGSDVSLTFSAAN